MTSNHGHGGDADGAFDADDPDDYGHVPARRARRGAWSVGGQVTARFADGSLWLAYTGDGAGEQAPWSAADRTGVFDRRPPRPTGRRPRTTDPVPRRTEDAMTSRNDQPDEQDPAYGHSFDARPLWSRRDRDADQLRELLRRGGFTEFTEGSDGFVVEHPDDGPMLLVHTGQLRAERVAAEHDYASLLEQAGYRFTPNATGDGEGWRVWPRSAAPGSGAAS